MIMNVGVDEDCDGNHDDGDGNHEDGDGNHDDGCTMHFFTSAGWSLFPQF